MFDVAAERLLETGDASVDLADGETRIEAQRQLDEHNPALATRPNPRDLMKIVGPAGERRVDRIADLLPR